MGNIEEFLGLKEDEKRWRIHNLRESIPTKPGIEYLKVIAKKYEVQPWPFVIYLACYNPQLLKEGLEKYLNYDAAENYQAIMEGLKEYVAIWDLVGILMKEKDVIDIKL